MKEYKPFYLELTFNIPLLLFVITMLITSIFYENSDLFILAIIASFIPFIINIIINIKGSKEKVPTSIKLFFSDFNKIVFVSLSFLVIGYNLGLNDKSTKTIAALNYYENFILVVAVISFFYAFILLVQRSEDSLSEKEEMIKELSHSESIPMEDFLNIAEENHANILAVAGNLNAIKTEKGLVLLKQFLSKKDTNILELFIPKTSEDSLVALKKEFKDKDEELSKQVYIKVLDPFVFLQGIVFAGQKRKGEGTYTRGYYLYKPMFSEKSDFGYKGIFVDIAGLDEDDDYCVAIRAYYYHLNGNDYHIDNNLRFVPGILKINDSPQKYIVEEKTLFDV